MTTQTTTSKQAQDDIATGLFSKTLRALRDRNGNDWTLADALATEVPVGRRGYRSGGNTDLERLAAVLEAEGISMKATTLRNYRDTSARWPKENRIDGISFSAHRAANRAMKKNRWAGYGQPQYDVAPAVKVLEDLRRHNGVVKVEDVATVVAGAKPKKANTEHARTLTALARVVDEIDPAFIKWAMADATRRASIEAILPEMSAAWSEMTTALQEAAKAPAHPAKVPSTVARDGSKIQKPKPAPKTKAKKAPAPTPSAKEKGGEIEAAPQRRGRKRGA